MSAANYTVRGSMGEFTFYATDADAARAFYLKHFPSAEITRVHQQTDSERRAIAEHNAKQAYRTAFSND